MGEKMHLPFLVGTVRSFGNNLIKTQLLIKIIYYDYLKSGIMI